MAPSLGTIRLATAADGEAILRIYAPFVAAKPTSFETEVPSAAEMGRRVQETLRARPWLVYEEGGVVGGYAYSSQHRTRAAYRWSVEVSVYIAQSFQRRHVAQALYTSLLRILAAQGLVNAYAGIALPNPASVALHEAMGFTQVAVYPKAGFKLGAWHDVGWWHLALNPHPAAPEPPRAFAAIAKQPDFAEMLRSGVSRIKPPTSD